MGGSRHFLGLTQPLHLSCLISFPYQYAILPVHMVSSLESRIPLSPYAH